MTLPRHTFRMAAEEEEAHAEKERQCAIGLGVYNPEDDGPMRDEYRQGVRGKIAQGLKSLRERKGTDGE